ncbi:MAG: hypothetical protein GY853_14850 [PVC group bacterium]|nr:hypothetical protein [PVC group bacterium]
MKKSVITLLLSGLLLSVSSIAMAGENAMPFQLSLVTPVSILDETQSVHGLRINLIYGSNENDRSWTWSY